MPRPLAWRVLAAISAANMLVAIVHFGLAAAAPLLRDELGLTSSELGLLLATVPAGLMLGTFAWGVLADRIGERRVLAGGFVGWSVCTLMTALAAHAAFDAGPSSSQTGSNVVLLGCVLLVAGVFGSCAHSAGGRALTAAYPPERHGLVLAIRHTAIPIGGMIGGLLVPLGLRDAGAMPVLGALAAAGLLVAAWLGRVVVDSATHAADGGARIADSSRSPLRVPELWLLGGSCSMLAFTQLGLVSFLTVQLVDEAGYAVGAAAVVFAVAQLAGSAARIAVGVASDRPGWRIRSLVVISAIGAATLLTTLVTPDAVDGLLLATALFVTTSWNGAAVAAAASFAPAGRTGAALGMQTTMFATMGVAAPILIGALLGSTGWSVVAGVFAVALVLATGGLALLAVRSGGARTPSRSTA